MSLERPFVYVFEFPFYTIVSMLTVSYNQDALQAAIPGPADRPSQGSLLTGHRIFLIIPPFGLFRCIVPVHLVHSGAFRCIPVHSGAFRCIPVHSGASCLVNLSLESSAASSYFDVNFL
jgi:hypothetical protein